MTRFFFRLIGALAVLAASVAPLGAQRWQVQYLYDENKSSLTINDLQFASANRGVAVGIIQEGSRTRPVAVVTSDGGAHWQLVPLKENPVSLFFLNENLGWMVTEKGVWQTTETGNDWRKLPKVPAPVFRVHFADERNGWAAGAKKTVLETHDGGQHWERLAAAAEQPGERNYSAYGWIVFASPQVGLITGWNQPPRRRPLQFPAWMDPEEALSRRDTPHLTIMLQTKDGGKTWKSSSASLFGQVTRVRLGPKGIGLGLIEFGESSRYPSEVLRMDWLTGKSQTIFRDKSFGITDVWVTPGGTAYLAGIQVTGELHSVLPGKVQVLKSNTNLTAWSKMEVDYRAVTNRTFFSAVDERSIWLATGNGMILKLAQ